MKFFFSRDKPVDLPQLPIDSGAEPDIDDLIVLGNQLEDARRFDEAEKIYEQAIRLAPQAFRGYLNLGNVMRANGRNSEAAEYYRQAIRLNTEYPASHLNLGNALLAEGEYSEAASSYRTATRCRPDWSKAWFGLGCALERIEPLDIDAVIEAYQEALRIDPDYGEALSNLAAALRENGKSHLARVLTDNFLTRFPSNIPALLTLAEIDKIWGDFEAAIVSYRRVLALAPEHDARSHFLWALNFVAGMRSDAILAEHRRYGEELLGRTLRCTPRLARNADKLLKIGYVSPDFRRHPISCFIEPVLRNHDRSNFEVHCYYNHGESDEITLRLIQSTDHWHDIANLSDESVSQLIKADEIDILVDLAGHTADNRLGIFACKPAPIQCTWLGYLCTTGLSTMDYRLCDAHTDPSPEAESWQVEKPLRLPDSQWCYQPPIALPDPSTLPRLRNGYWTFGSPNQASKLNDVSLRTWATLLAAIPGSRLRLIGVTDTVFAGRIRSAFVSQGVSAERIDIIGRVPVEEYFSFYRDIDIALDTFPYNGATTTCDALLMGVPVATVAGNRAIARGGVSLLTTLGLQKWIAPSIDEFVGMLVQHCQDPARMAALRSELPKWMRASALMDAPRFTRNLETLYRDIWKHACAESAAG